MDGRFKVYGTTDNGYISQHFERASEARAYYDKFYPLGGELLRVDIDGIRISDLTELDQYAANEG